MKNTEILIVGAGPAGLCAAKAAAAQGAQVAVCERDEIPGGQLVKQTHKFFGSKAQYAGDRGNAIGEFLVSEAAGDPKIEIMPQTTVIGIYEDGVVLAERMFPGRGDGEIIKIKPRKIIIATGAAENFLLFPGNDLPGIYGAGAVQTLMNVSGVVPGKRVLMLGASNIGLIVSYQLAQAGVEVAAVVRRSPQIGGYLVHASKIRRLGIPVRTRYTIKEAYGNGKVEGAVIYKVDDKKQPVAGSEEDIKCDTICLAVGLSPLTELCSQAGCKMAYISELSGHVPVIDRYLATTNPDVYVAGDVSGVEEASSAMVEGRLAGVSAALSLGYGKDTAAALQERAIAELEELRAGPVAADIRRGVEKLEKLSAGGA
ncbi:MAG: NAD(P)/FAD-dependent oxidoreductase [Spirochaetes bacterium]|nr:NAD(P)/FAD-dependent oxidoreductase [Spirochaetota bacterium]